MTFWDHFPPSLDEPLRNAPQVGEPAGEAATAPGSDGSSSAGGTPPGLTNPGEGRAGDNGKELPGHDTARPAPRVRETNAWPIPNWRFLR